MRLHTVLTLGAVAACLSAAVAATNVTLIPVSLTATQTPSQVFVRDQSGNVIAPRPDDDPTALIFNAGGDPLYFTLEKWTAASGTAEIAPAADGSSDHVALTLRGQIAFGHYSVFLRSDTGTGQQLTPLDGSGLTNNYDARQDGTADVEIDTPQRLTPGSWIVTIYHSDDQDHGNYPGEMTRTAHQQLTVKVP